ncbi:DNRLRE domain-containing protein [Pseudofrankia sp. BMG5.37]|uniref:DNRLRE domain-containing protein n=1 Tax=Pseudofrankia sp. BMG5.37 TaxID=3050035 RepID=UPI002895017C|nr:DNRLRE domain-containing protein [Pseudofrankia sp. BMG5.37]MDT3443600.1 DNRLRE domain-containing protein [Pseudofrankia sp. BMG5.37]
MALLLVPVLVMTAVALVVIDRVTQPGMVPISEQNPFRDGNVKLPESTSGSAANRGHEAPTSVTQAGAGSSPSAAAVRGRVGEVPGAVPVTPETAPRKIDYSKVTLTADRPAAGTPSAGGEAAKPLRAGMSMPATLAPGARDPGKVQQGRVEVPGGRTENATEFRNPDGTHTADVSMGRERFRDAKGDLVDIDTALVAGDRGRFHSRATQLPVDIAGSANDAQLARVDLGGGVSAGFALEGAAASRASVKGFTASFPGVRTSSDLQLHSTASGLVEVMVLHGADAPTTWTFPLALSGLTASMDRYGQVVLADKDGKPRALIPHGWMQDAGTSGAAGGPAMSTGVTYSLVDGPDKGQVSLRVELDKAWLSAPERVFPVQVDPPVTWLDPAGDDTYVSSLHPSTPFSSEWTLKNGMYLTDVNRSYIHFDGQPELTDANVLGVDVYLYNWLSAQSCVPNPVSLREVTQSWDGTSMTWPGAAVGPEVAQSWFAYSYDTACGPNWGHFSDPRLTELVGDWADGSKQNTGLEVETSSTNSAAYKEFYSASCLCNPADPPTDLRPHMAVTWSPYGADYEWPSGSPQWSTNVTANSPGEIPIRVTNTGQSTWPAYGNYKLSYHVYDASGTTELVHQGAVTELPTSVARGESIDLAAAVDPLPAGDYVIYFDMEDWGTAWFSSHGISAFGFQAESSAVAAPGIVDSSPLDGEHVPTLRPELSLTGSTGGLSYEFQICDEPDAQSGNCWDSGGLTSSSTWKVPAYALEWGEAYYWRGRVSDGSAASGWTPPIALVTDVAAPVTSQHFGTDPYVPSVASVTPLIGNYTASTTDVSVPAVGPALTLTRTYNSRNPYVGLFGQGWSSQWDMNVKADDTGEGNLVVRYPDGREGRFGRNWDGSYVSQDGYYSVVRAPSPRVASFTGPDSNSSLGDTDTGETWTVLSGSWGIEDNAAKLVSAGSGSRSLAVMNAASDGTIRFTVPTAQDRVGIAFRAQDNNNYWSLYVKPSSGALVLAKRVGGTETTVATYTGACCSADDTYAIGMAGSVLTVYRNDRVVGSVTDGQFSTVTQAGLYASTTGSGRIGSVVMVDDQHRDTFTNANSSTGLGWTDNGENWQSGQGTGAGTWGTSSNAAYLATASGDRNLVTVPAAADGTFTFKEPVAQAGVGLAFRYADAENYWRLVAQPGAGAWQLVRRVGGTETVVATSAGGTCCTAGDTLTITTAGASIVVARNGSQILSVTDTAVLHGSRVGPFAEATGAGRIDDFSATAATVLTDKTGTGYTFRSDGRLAQVVDVAGRSLTLNYDTSAKLTSVVNNTTGRTLTLTWTGTHVTTVATPTVAAYSGPLSWTYGYSGDKLTTVTGPQSTNPTTYGYNGSGQLTQTTLPAGNVDAKIGYNGDGTVAWREDGEGNRTEYAVLATSPNPIIRVTDPRGHDEDWEYHGGQLISHRDGFGDRRFVYNDRGFLSQVTDENGNVVQTATDDRGNVIARTTARANVYGTLWTNTEYYEYYDGPPGDPRDNKITIFRDARSSSPTDDTYATTYEYNPYGDLVSQTTPATGDFPSGRTETWAYSDGTENAIDGGTIPRGLPVSYTDARGKVTAYGYSSKGDLRHDQDPAGLVHDYTYDELGRRLTSKETSDSFPSGLTTSFTYSKLSQLATITEPAAANLITSVTHTPVTTNTYDENGNLTETVVSDATGGDTVRTTTYDYDDDDRQTSVTEAAGTPIEATSEVSYDENGNVATSTDPNGTVVEFGYTEHNQLATTTVKDFVDDPVAGSEARDLLVESRAYDPAGRLASVTDSLGRTTSYTYWLDDRPHQVIFEGYHVPDFTVGELSNTETRNIVLEDHGYDAAGNETSTTAGGGLRAVTAGYDEAGRNAWTSVDPEGLNRWTTYDYDAVGNLLASTHGADGTFATDRVEYGYDDASRLASTTVLGDGTDRFTAALTRDARGFVTSTVDPRGYTDGSPFNSAYVTDQVTDAAGRLTQRVAPPVQVEQNGAAAATDRPSAEVGYNTFGELTQSRDARNQVTTTSYDALGQVTQITHPSYTPPGGSAITPTESWTYDDNGNPLTHTDTRGQTVTTVYDKLDRIVAVTDPQVTGQPEAGVSRYVYDDAGNLLDTVDQNGAWTIYAYDDLDRLWASSPTERSPLQAFTTYIDHDDAGDVTRTLRPSNFATGASATAVYNGAGDLTEQHDEADKVTSYTYDQSGRITSVTDPLGRSAHYTYDRAGRQTTTEQYSDTDTLLRSTSVGYDPAGNVTSQTDPNGHASTFTYDALGQLRTITVPVSSGTSITSSAGYDAAGNRTRLTDGLNNTTTYTFNSLGLPEKTIEPSTTAYPNLADRTWQVSYDAGGLPTAQLEPGGVIRAVSYDELGRVTAETGSGGGATAASRAMSYDLVGNLAEVDEPGGGSQMFGYNDRGLLTGAWGDGGTSSFVYDEEGRTLQRADPGSWSDYYYDARSRLVAVGAAITGDTRGYDYDDAGQLTSIDYHGGTGATQTFDYDQLGRLTDDTLAGPSGTLRDQTYAYDNNDNLTSTTITGTGTGTGTGVAGAGTQTYGYDWADRLTSWTNQSSATTTYGWDEAGNRTSTGGTTATFDARNRLTSDGTASYTYTARGTLSTRTAGSATTTTAFDAFDRLTSHTAGPTTTSYSYDGLDRIATRNTSRQFLYDGLDLEPGIDGNSAYARDPSGAVIGAGTDDGASATIQNLHGDTVAAFTTDGTLTDTKNYDPFGQPLTPGNTNIQTGYQSSWTDPDTGLVKAQARWYNPATATFLTRDTYSLGWTGTAADNRYTYAGGNPLTNNDTTGYASDNGHWDYGYCNTGSFLHQATGQCKTWIPDKSPPPASATNDLRSSNDVPWGTLVLTPRPPSPPTVFVVIVPRPAGGGNRTQSAPSKPATTTSGRPATTTSTGSAAAGAATTNRPAAAPVASPAAPAAPAITIDLAQWIAATPKPSTLPADAAAASSFVVLPVNALPVGALPIAAPAPGTNPAAAPAAAYTPARAADPVYGYGDSTILIAYGVASSPGQDPLATTGAPDRPQPVEKNCDAWCKLKGAGSAIGHTVTSAATGAWNYTRNHPVDVALNAAMIGLAFVPVGGELADAAIIGWRAERGIQSGITLARTAEAEPEAATALRGIGRALENCATGKPGGNSFTPTTPVLLADGTTKPIDQVHVGDKVLTTDPDTGKTEPHTVTAVIVGHGDKQLVDITIHTDHGPATLTATNGHPLYDTTTHTWTTADHLTPGHTLRQPDGTTATITTTHLRHQTTTAYNLTIDKIHTYYVEVGGAAVLVHNCGVGEYDIVRYRPSNAPLENHHGIMDAWAKNNVPGYVSRASDNPTIALSSANHGATKVVFRDWLEENYGARVGVKVDWASIGPREIYSLSERMFDAAGVPQAARDAYYGGFNRYIYGLG